MSSPLSVIEFFSKARANEICDGFLWPYEAGRLPDFKWDDGTAVVRYETVFGTLFLGEGDYKAYGFLDEQDFSSAAKRGALTSNAPRGIITLGSLRKFPPTTRGVFFITPKEKVKLSFNTSGPEEESAVILALQGLGAEESSLVATSRFLGGVKYPTKSFVNSFNDAFSTKQRPRLIALLLIGAVATFCSFAGLRWHNFYIVGALLGFLFVSLVGILYHRVEESSSE